MGDVHDGKIDQLAALGENWDSHHARPLTAEALRVLRGVHVVPTVTGGVQIEVYVNGWETEIEFNAAGEPTSVIMERATGPAADG